MIINSAQDIVQYNVMFNMNLLAPQTQKMDVHNLQLVNKKQQTTMVNTAIYSSAQKRVKNHTNSALVPNWWMDAMNWIPA